MSDTTPRDRLEALVAQLSLDEKCAMVSGDGPFTIPGCDRLGIPGWRCSDGPVGVRGMGMGPGLVVPGASAIAASWDVTLVEQIGAVLGEEAIAKDVDVVLGPTVNLHRSPRGGRHFEAYSEDPELSARIATAYITGVQSRGVAACIKHLVCNDQEHERTTIDVHVDERTLREVYLRPFEAAVADADVKAVMASYNFVNGHHACAQPHVLVDVLEREWRFDGVVMSDWGAMKSTVDPAVNGLHLEMPGPGERWGDGRLRAAIEAGDVPVAELDDKVLRILRLLDWRGRLPGTTIEVERVPAEQPAHRVVARRAAAAGMVLARNDGTLPLATGCSIALIGHGAAATTIMGGGSASLIPYRTTTVLDELRERWSGSITHVAAVDLRRSSPTLPAAWLPEGVEASVYSGASFDGVPVAVERRDAVYNVWIAEELGVPGPLATRLRFPIVPDETATFRLMAGGLGEVLLQLDGVAAVENTTDPFSAGLGVQAGATEIVLEQGRRYEVVVEQRPTPGSTTPYSLVDVGVAAVDARDAEARFAEAEAAAAAADVAVVVVGSTQEWESEGHDRSSMRLPLEQDELVRRVAAVNPRTVVVLNSGAPVELPWIDDAAALLLAWYPGQEGGVAITDVLVGDSEPGGRMPTTWARHERDTPSYLHYPGEAGVVRYGEELFVGHRWYDARGIEPLLPFGHGTSYTTFEWGSPRASVDGTDVDIEIPVTNTGSRAGSEVVQIYVAPCMAPILRPVKQLAGFDKVQLEPGEAALARLHLDEVAFRRWDPATSAWTVDPGAYDLVVAASATDEHARVRVEIRTR